jgi:hypothetical protein
MIEARTIGWGMWGGDRGAWLSDVSVEGIRRNVALTPVVNRLQASLHASRICSHRRLSSEVTRDELRIFRRHSSSTRRETLTSL